MANSPDSPASSITQSEFDRAVTSNNYPEPSRTQYNAFKTGLRAGCISTRREAAMALAQILHESGGLQCKKEKVPPHLQCGRSTGGDCTSCYAKLGENSRRETDPPGKFYYGRGYIQISGCANYRAASHDLGFGDILVSNPDLVTRTEELCWKTAFFYWKRVVHPYPGVARGAFGCTTRAINPTLENVNHPKAIERFNIYNSVYRSFEISGNPSPNFNESITGVRRDCTYKVRFWDGRSGFKPSIAYVLVLPEYFSELSEQV